MSQMELKTIDDCTLNEITQLWNIGFQQYFSNMTRTAEQMAVHLGQHCIHPSLSVAAYIGGVPAGFVLIGMKTVNGKKTAWNGGTGVNPAFRGQGIARVILQEAIRLMRAEGVSTVSLEVRTDNFKAISAYQSAGFQTLHEIPIVRRNGDFAALPFRRGANPIEYSYVIGTPDQVAGISFYQEHCAWNSQWFNSAGSQSLIAYDHLQGKIAGYSLFYKSHSATGELMSIQLTHCEANPELGNSRDIIRFMLAQVFAPYDCSAIRTGHYLRSTNEDLMLALAEAGFKTELAENLMILHL